MPFLIQRCRASSPRAVDSVTLAVWAALNFEQTAWSQCELGVQPPRPRDTLRY